jgi:hypothetical protein
VILSAAAASRGAEAVQKTAKISSAHLIGKRVIFALRQFRSLV